MTEYQLVRSKRKTLAIHITPDATVEVRAPLTLSKSRIDAFVEQKQDWIIKNLEHSKKILKTKKEFSFDETTKLWFMGKQYSLRDSADVRFDGEYFYAPYDCFDSSKKSVIKLYRNLAERVIKERVAYYSKFMNVKPTAIKINGAMKRWGSCSGQNSLNFSWALIMSDMSAIDYVVVHELAHIKQHNHSKQFWSIVASVLPDYKLREKKLRALQKELVKQNWK